MPKSVSFFLSRITKGGTLDVPKVLDAIRQSVSVESRDYAWTIVDVSEGTATHREETFRYLGGSLVKYDPDATIEVVDEAVRKTRLQSEPNLQRASSLFVYFPDEAIFAHKRVWNEIRPRDFRVQMADLIESYHRKFLVECELQAVADLTRFLTKLSQLEDVTEIKARVTPPNPLFGAFWEPLKLYIEQRRLRKMAIAETAKSGESLPTTAPEIAKRIESESTQAVKPAPIGDAALLMAADGYGSAAVTGRRGSQIVVVKTSENAIEIKMDADATAPELADALAREVVRLRRTRKHQH